MPITSHTDSSRELTTLTATGGETFEEIIEVVKGFKDDPPEKNILWNNMAKNIWGKRVTG